MGNCADAVGTAARLPGGATDAEEYPATPAVGRRSVAQSHTQKSTLGLCWWSRMTAIKPSLLLACILRSASLKVTQGAIG